MGFRKLGADGKISGSIVSGGKNFPPANPAWSSRGRHMSKESTTVSFKLIAHALIYLWRFCPAPGSSL